MHHPLDQAAVLAGMVRSIVDVRRLAVQRLGNLEREGAFTHRFRPGDEIGMRQPLGVERAAKPGLRVTVTDQGHMPVRGGGCTRRSLSIERTPSMMRTTCSTASRS